MLLNCLIFFSIHLVCPSTHPFPHRLPLPKTKQPPTQVLRHDLGAKREVGTLSEAAPHLILDNFTSKLGARVATILKHLFPPPRPDAKRVITFANRGDFISFRHHTTAAPRGPASTTLTEVGPRFELKLYQIRLGTLDAAHAADEWALRAYLRSAKKAKLAEDGGLVGGGGAGGGGVKDDFVVAARSQAPRKKRKGGGGG
jgi:U3 small nucleolar ribonucleoprotein protein IMP4